MVDAAGEASMTGASPGQMLRAARERKGLSLQEAADGLNLKPRIIEALETDSYEQLPPRTFVKGYLRAYAKLVDVKEYDVLAAFEQQQPEQPPEPMPPGLAQPDAGGGWLKWFVLGVALLLLGYLAFDAYRPTSNTSVVPEQPDAEAPQAPVPVVPAPGVSAPGLERPAAQPQATPQVPRDAPPQPVQPPEPAQQAPQPAPAPEQQAQAPVEPTAPAERPPATAQRAADTPASAPAAPLTISVTRESWVEITDANGVRRYAGLVQGPRTLRVDGPPPFDVVIGNAAAVELRYAGEGISLPSRRPGRVLRLTVPASP